MYTKANKIIISTDNLENYIEDVDVYNSKLLMELGNPAYTKVPYELTTQEYRPDLIAQDFYGSTNWQGLVIIQAGRNLSSYTKGSVIQLLPKATILGIISNL